MKRSSRLVHGNWIAMVLLACGLCAAPARASYHLWQITEVYSNASGTVQFIEMHNIFGGENFVHSFGASISSGSKNFSFPTDLVGDTTNKNMLIATPGYAALSGVPAADYVLPSNNFFSTTSDTLSFTGGLNTFTFSAGQLPTNGNSLNRAYGGSTISSALNSPTNFAGQSGVVPVPEPATMGAMATCATLLRMRRKSARTIPCR